MSRPDRWDVIVVGAGPAGLTVGHRLAEAGWSVVVVDPRVPFEKPCGGGLTPRTWDWLPVERTAFRTRRDIDRVILQWDDARAVEVELPKPLSVLSRHELGERLLERLRSAGGVFLPYRARSVEERDGAWLVHAEPGDGGRASGDPSPQTLRASWVVFADGVYGLSRRRWGHFSSADDWTRAVGYLIPGTDDAIRIQFWSGRDGYAWVFPRADATSVGLCDTLRGLPEPLFRRLDTWAGRHGWESARATHRYGYLIPSPGSIRPWFPLWGDRWARVGDASGFVDPVTREGIFFAVQGGHVLAECLRRGTFPGAWSAWLERTRWPEWRAAVRWRRRFYRPWFLRAVLWSTRWRRFYRLLQGVLVGEVPYTKLIEAVL